VGVLLRACKSSEEARERTQEAKRSGRMPVKKAKSASDKFIKKKQVSL